MQIKIADHQNGADQNDADHHHQGVGVTLSGDEAREMMGGAWMKCFAHVVLHSKMYAMHRAETRTGTSASPDGCIFAQSWNLASSSLPQASDGGIESGPARKSRLLPCATPASSGAFLR